MRARNLKPALFKNEILGSADPLYTVVFEGLWCFADREGRLEDRPLRIHAEVNPYRPSASTVRALGWLVQHGFVVRYTVNGQNYLTVTAFSKHQQPHVREPESRIPPHTNQEVVEAPGQHSASTSSAPLTPDSGLLTPDCGLLKGPRGTPGLNLPVWDRWIEYRKSIRKPLKAASMQSAAKLLAKLGEQQEAVVEQSIANGWQGLFALKLNGNGHAKTPDPTKTYGQWEPPEHDPEYC